MFWQNRTHSTAISLIISLPFYLLGSPGLQPKNWKTVWTPIIRNGKAFPPGSQDALSGIKTVKTFPVLEDREVKNLEQASSAAYADYIHRALLANKYEFCTENRAHPICLPRLCLAMAVTWRLKINSHLEM